MSKPKFAPAALTAVYDVYDELGRGAQAVVYLARDRKAKQMVAIKTFTKASLSPKEREQVQAEIDILKKLDHPNLLKIIDTIEDPTYIFIVAELCEGGELFERIVEREKYTERDAQIVLKEIASALDYCHTMRIVHRDLKPENILLSSTGDDAVVKIADFGFAKHHLDEDLTSHVGTYAYCAPEILLRKEYDASVDMWSFGVIVYVMLCGYLPFVGDNPAVLVKKITAGEFEFESPYWDGISTEAKDLIKRCLSLDPKTRISAAQVLKHPWIVNELPENDLTPAMDELKRLLHKRMIKRTIMSVVTTETLKTLATKMMQGRS